jgi:diguanylate cyclase (GGDEF)-like protein
MKNSSGSPSPFTGSKVNTRLTSAPAIDIRHETASHQWLYTDLGLVKNHALEAGYITRKLSSMNLAGTVCPPATPPPSVSDRGEVHQSRFVGVEDIRNRLHEEMGYTLSTIAQENRMLRQENRSLKQRLTRVRNHNELLLKLNETINGFLSITDRKELIQAITRSVCDDLDFDSAILWFVDKNEQKMVPISWANVSYSMLSQLDISTERQPYPRILQEGKTLCIVDDIREQFEEANQLLQHFHSLRSVLECEVIFLLPVSTVDHIEESPDGPRAKVETSALLMVGRQNRSHLRECKNLLQQYAVSAGRSLCNVNLYDFLQENYRSYRQQAVTDGLTGLYNRRFFNQELDREIQRSYRHLLKMSLVLMDVDHFKKYNDSNGHQAGDAVLRKVADVLRSQTRVCDMECRYGGEEFAIILPETSKRQARVLAEKIRKEIEQTHFEFQDNQPGGRVTISVGVSTFPDDAVHLKDLIEKADQALYRAKEGGRNSVVLAES